jgi:hypothetical protein
MATDGACGADDLANALTTTLSAGVNFDLPVVDLTSPDFSVSMADDGLAALPVHLTISL